MLLHGKSALITGAAKGLGKLTAMLLAEQGCNVAVNYRNSRREAENLAVELRSRGVRSAAIQADIQDAEQRRRLLAEASAQVGHPDILINNAGPYIRERKPFAEYDREELNRMVHGNLLSAMDMDLMVLPGMRGSGWGRIIHFGFSRAGEARGWPYRAAYAAAKMGLVSFTKSLAVEEAGNGITVNMICPGDIRGGYKEQRIADVQQIEDQATPRGRPGTGEDVARSILFLCDAKSDFITGNILEVSGGWDPIYNPGNPADRET